MRAVTPFVERHAVVRSDLRPEHLVTAKKRGKRRRQHRVPARKPVQKRLRVTSTGARKCLSHLSCSSLEIAEGWPDVFAFRRCFLHASAPSESHMQPLRG